MLKSWKTFWSMINRYLEAGEIHASKIQIESMTKVKKHLDKNQLDKDAIKQLKDELKELDDIL